MKTILVPVEVHPSVYPVLETALLVARRFGSYVEGIPLAQDIPAMAIEMIGPWAYEAERADRKQIENARQLFENFMTSHAIPPYSEPGQGPAFRWGREEPVRDSHIGSYSRVFDAIVIGRPDATGGIPRSATLETALFEGGRPLVLAPPSPPKSLGSTILVAWNGSTETARAVAFAMPFLVKADHVIVLTIEGWTADGPTGGQLVTCLQRNGIKVEAMTRPGKSSTAGETILDHAASLDADLLVKGAYTQSRLRQMIFGGATHHILTHAQLPVLMAH